SNVMNQRRNNSIGQYVTNLPMTLRLDSDWKVGIAEIHYTNSWLNLKKYNEILIVDYLDHRVKFCEPAFLQPGRYSDINQLLYQISILVRPSADVISVPMLGHN